MNEIMKFEGTAVECKEVDGVWMFELYSVGMALGQIKIAKGKSYPRKDRIDENVKSAEIKPVVRNGQLFITESQVYDLMLEARTDKCRAFRKWLTNEVLPALNRKGIYTMPNQGKQLRLDEKPYEYYDKTWNGEPLLTTEDVEHLAGIDRSTVCYYLRKSSFVENTDYYHLKGINLEQFKGQNPKIPKNINHLILITKTGFRKLCTYAGVELSEPQCFIEQKAEPKRRLIQLPSKGMKSLMGYIQEETKAIDSIAYLLMTKDTKENHEAYRSCMMEHIRRIKVLSLDVEHIII